MSELVTTPVRARLLVDLVRIARCAAIAMLASAMANSLVFGIARWLSGGDLSVADGPTAIELVPLRLADVVVASAVPVAPAVITLAVLRRYTSHPRRHFIRISVVVGLLSLGPVLLLPSGIATKVTLTIMHAVAAVLIAGTLVWGSTGSARRP